MVAVVAVAAVAAVALALGCSSACPVQWSSVLHDHRAGRHWSTMVMMMVR